MLGAVIAVPAIALISGTLIKPEARWRVNWTNVSTNTKVGWKDGQLVADFQAYSCKARY
jgi:hypothetical protein